MKLFIFFLLIPFLCISSTNAQTEDMSSEKQALPYEEIGEYPDSYTGALVAARMIDGLGYRYYWATEGLREEDMAFKPSEDARSFAETMEHLYGLSGTIVNASKNAPNVRPGPDMPEGLEALRRRTLENLKEASDILKADARQDLDNLKVIFQRGENSSEFPYWNMLNGPIADAIYHTGQIVSFRRTAGNPMNPKVGVFMGKTRE